MGIGQVIGEINAKSNRYAKGMTGRGQGPKPPANPSTARGKRRKLKREQGK